MLDAPAHDSQRFLGRMFFSVAEGNRTRNHQSADRTFETAPREFAIGEREITLPLVPYEPLRASGKAVDIVITAPNDYCFPSIEYG